MSQYDEVESFSDRERLAIEFADTEIGDELIDRMRAHFSDAEILELSATVGFCMGIGRIYTVLDIANECRLVH